MKVLVYSNYITPRLEYVFKWCFEYFFSSKLQIVSSIDEFQEIAADLRINYSEKNIQDCLTFKPAKLLFEDDIKFQEVDLSLYNNLPILFPCSEGGELPFDPFSAIFFLISRYEEYLPFITDIHGRFEAEHSFLYKTPFLNIPLADYYILTIEKIIQKTYPKIEIKKTYKFIPTFDIDIAFAYLGRNFYRTIGGIAKSVFTGNFADIYHRIRVILRFDDDPFDTYLFLRKLHKNLLESPIFFINMGDYTRYDKNIPYNHPLLSGLIGKLAQHAKIGIHPSYFTIEDPTFYNEEIYRLQQITGWRITRSRQHYLRLYLPETYQQLIKAGIEEDYTMGYAQKPGFRAGTSHPFNFYNLKTEQITKLKIFPFCIMDGTLKEYMKLSPQQTMPVIENFNKEVRKVKGNFITVWHNESVSEYKRWKGWSEVYKYLVEIAS